MAPLPSRKSLESMKRADLQKICKDYGVKANLKSEALIDLLLDSQSTPAPQPTRRSVSTRQSSRAGPSRVSSMIVHDISEGEEEEVKEESTNSQRVQEESAPSPPILPPRTRKAKELQTRLGVGKPVLAGGSGPRAVTRSSGSSRGKRAKSSKSVKPREATIEEEPEILSVSSKDPFNQQETQQASSSSPHNPHHVVLPADNDSGMIDAKRIVEDAIRPLQDQIRTLKSELHEVQTIKSDIATLQTQVAEVCKAQKDMQAEFLTLRDLSSIVASLKEEIRQLRQVGRPPSRPSTPKPKSGQLRQGPLGFGLPSIVKNATFTLPIGSDPQDRPNPSLPHPGVAESTLGKRHRDSASSSATDAVEEGQEDEYSDGELTKKVVRPTKKRPKMQNDEDSHKDTQLAGSSHPPPQSDIQPGTSSSNRGVSTFTVFGGSEDPSDYIDPPPTDHLPDFFEADSPPGSSSNNRGARSIPAIPTSSANAAENQPFNFAFAPISSTPHNAMYLPSFPYPEPPQSPSPAGPSLPTFSGRHQEERTDIFKSFGLPSPIRSTRHYGALSHEERGVNPAALTQRTSGKQREVSSNDVAAGLGLTAVRTASSSDPTTLGADAPTTKRTMFGTELEGDTRFGDFGVEGVASGFWSSKF